MSLVHHVCKETPGLESLFLISKSNCAFANFKDEASSVAAQQKLHESKFQSVRLVSRLRKNTADAASSVTGPNGQRSSASSQASLHGADQEDPRTPTSTASAVDPRSAARAKDGMPQRDKFFILKSLTAEDLELSVRTGVWATQAHNEEALNNAFKVG